MFSASICFIYFVHYSHSLLDHIGMIQSLFFSSLGAAASFQCSSWHSGDGFCPIVPPKLHLWLWFQPSAILCLHLLRICTAFGGARECLLGCVWHGAISVSGLSLEGLPMPKHLSIRNVLLTVWKSMFANVCVLCWFGSMPPSSPCPRRPWKNAITESLATVAWAPLLGFVQANKWWLTANPQRWVFLSLTKTDFHRPLWLLRLCHDHRLARCPLAGTHRLA